MTHPIVRGAVWLVCALALLAIAFVAGLWIFYESSLWLDLVPDERRREFQTMLAMYFRVVGLKGLFPQLLLVFALWPVVGRLVPRTGSSGRSLLLGLVLTSSIAFAVVAPLLLTRESPGWPALHMTSLRHVVLSYLTMTSAVVAAAAIPRRLVPALRIAAPTPDP